LKSPDKSWKSLFILTVSMKISTLLNLDWKVLILKILTQKKNNLVLTVRIISTSFKSWSRQIKKSWSWARLVSTVETPRLTFVELTVFCSSSCQACLKYWLRLSCQLIWLAYPEKKSAQCNYLSMHMEKSNSQRISVKIKDTLCRCNVLNCLWAIHSLNCNSSSL